MILDTSFLIDLMDGNPGASAYAQMVEESGIKQRIPAQVVYELYVGVGYTEAPNKEIQKIQSVLENRPLEDLTPEIAKLAGRMDGRLRREGERVSPNDVIIGATARHYGEPVLTGNPSDFEKLPQVKFNTYSK